MRILLLIALAPALACSQDDAEALRALPDSGEGYEHVERFIKVLEAVRDNHPDRLLARGLPEEAVKMAEQRLIRINRAYEQIGGRAA